VRAVNAPAGDVFDELSWRGMVHQATDDDLGPRLEAEPFGVYVGIDVTAPSLHVGNLPAVLALRRFQRAGHKAIALLGGGTTLIGDPSGKEAERPLLSSEEIEAHTAGIRAQLEAFIEFGPGPADATLLDNAEWLGSLGLTAFLRDIGKHFTVNSMIAKESVRARLDEREQGISFTEFSYMLLQAYDFLHLFDTLGCRLQMGGSDQWGNITAGVDLVRRARRAEVYGFTWPLLTKADGTKFGKTESGAVWLDPALTSPYQFFQFWIRTDDRDVGRLLALLTDLDRPRIDDLESSVRDRPQDRQAQEVLAWELTTSVHGSAAAEIARRAARALFAGEVVGLDRPAMLEALNGAPSTSLDPGVLAGDGESLVALMTSSGLASSRSAARQAIAQGGVYVNDVRQDDVDRRVRTVDVLDGGYVLLRKGKRSYHVLRLE